MAVVLESNDQSARDRFPAGARARRRGVEERQTGIVTLDGVKWAKAASGPARGKAPTTVNQVLAPGDVIYAEPLIDKDGKPIDGQFRLRQIPEVSGAMVAMDPWTGRVLAMVGGFSFDQSQFNRATQAYRQPGSSFKPLVYSAAIDNGYTPSTIVMDAPIEIDQGQGAGVWRPENYSTGKYYGPQTLRYGIEQSRNTMTVRLAQDIGMPLIGEYAKRFGVYDDLPNYLSYALGAGETTVMRMVTAYSMFANGGRRVKPTMIDRIQDRYGHTIYKHDQRECRGCDAPGGWKNQAEPTCRPARAGARSDDGLPDHLDHGRRGSARHRNGREGSRQADRRQDRHHQRRKGRLVHRLLAGHRGRRLSRLRQAAPHLGRGATGGASGSADRQRFPQVALADKPAVPFRVPAGIKLIRVDAKSGMRAGPGEGGRHPRSVQAWYGAAGQLLCHRRRGRRRARPPLFRRKRAAIMRPEPDRAFTSIRSSNPLDGSSGRIALCSRADRYIPSSTISCGSHRRSETPCALKSNALLKRSSSQSGC